MNQHSENYFPSLIVLTLTKMGYQDIDSNPTDDGWTFTGKAFGQPFEVKALQADTRALIGEKELIVSWLKDLIKPIEELRWNKPA